MAIIACLHRQPAQMFFWWMIFSEHHQTATPEMCLMFLHSVRVILSLSEDSAWWLHIEHIKLSDARFESQNSPAKVSKSQTWTCLVKRTSTIIISCNWYRVSDRLRVWKIQEMFFEKKCSWHWTFPFSSFFLTAGTSEAALSLYLAPQRKACFPQVPLYSPQLFYFHNSHWTAQC